MASPIAPKNLDVARTSRDSKIGDTKGVKGELAQTPHLYSLCASAAQPSAAQPSAAQPSAAQPSAAQPDQQRDHAPRRYRVGGTKYLTVPQATNIIEAVQFAKSMGLPLVAHLTIHWAYTDAADDPDGKLFARFREGLSKWLRRQGIEFAAGWARERMSSGQAEVVHCHMLFHLPMEYCTKRKLQAEAAIYRLIKRHGRGYWAEEVIDLRIHENPDGKYLIKGGGRVVWKRFRIRKEHRRLQGIIHGKRCGTTQNIGRASRRAWAWMKKC
jgi:hypothetical protein